MRQTRSKIPVLILLFSLLFLSGCGTRVVRVRSTDPQRTAEEVEVRVWVKDKDGQWVKSKNKVRFEEGVYMVDDPEANPKESLPTVDLGQ